MLIRIEYIVFYGQENCAIDRMYLQAALLLKQSEGLHCNPVHEVQTVTCRVTSLARHVKEDFMDLASKVYTRYLAAGGIKGRLWYFVRKILIILLNDPVCTMQIHGRRLKLPLSHQLPAILKHCPFYDQLPARISAYFHRTNRHLICIDVGANIGDSIASFYTNEADTFLAIEPNPGFNRLLTSNWGWNRNVTVVSDICSSESGSGTFSIQEKNGTASIVTNEDGIRMSRRTLDEIVAGYPSAPDINVLKIDTDGHDLDVLAGAGRTIAQHMPVILFECEPVDADYIRNCLKTLNDLQGFGYSSFILYDSKGNLIDLYSLSDLSAFEDQLSYQMKHDFHDFDVLIMKDEDIFQFYKSENDCFKDRDVQKKGTGGIS
jgi:FkbM family methyltransferase